MRVVKIIALVLLVAFVGIQFMPTERNQSDVVSKTDFMLVNDVPQTIKKKLQVSCYDCHSNNTYYPWYNKIQPASWLMENHIKKGKKELNFSEFGAYSNRKQKSKIKSIINQIKDDEMPLTSYTLIHNDALLSQSEKSLIIDYMKQLKDSLE